MIRNEVELLSHFGCDTRERLSRALYKATSCGMWIQFTDTGVKLGSIVEGCDFGTAVYPLNYPFEAPAVDARVKAIEAEAEVLWKWANSEDDGTDAPDVYLDFLHLKPEGVLT